MSCAIRVVLFCLLLLTGNRVRGAESFDVVIYGATPAGIASALAAGGEGQKVLLVEPTARIGGLVTSGLSHTDYHAYEGLTGAFLDFSKRVEAHYRAQFGADSIEVKNSMRGTQSEPKVNLMIYEKMLAEVPKVKIWRKHGLADVRMGGMNEARRIVTVTFMDHSGKRTEVAAKVFIDGSYEGDLMAKAGVKYHVGREAQSEYGESLAPEQGDKQVQGYNFRFCMTKEPGNRVMPSMPAGYKREDFEGVLPLYAKGTLKGVFGYSTAYIFKAQPPPLANGKYDINDMSRGPVRLSLPGHNYEWPEGDAATRKRIFDDHLRWDVGLLYFLQNDAAVPAKIRDEAREWGWCKDEFVETGHIPPQLYVREARRMVGQYVFTQKDTEYAPGDARAVLRKDVIAMGEYGPNCHGTSHEGSPFGGKHSGEFYHPVAPYQIPYGVLVPRDVENLLVPGAMSASHVGFCGLRLEPIWMSLGQAAGLAAHQAVAEMIAVQKVSTAKVRTRLHAVGGATVYTSDVPPGHKDFAAVQWWGTAGGLHGLEPSPAKPGQRGKNIISQYSETYPGHDVHLDRVLDAALAERWAKLAKELGVKGNLPKADGKVTRGEWIRAAFKGK
jgi:hypothetical protein